MERNDIARSAALIAAFVVFALLVIRPAQAQRAPGDVGLGLQVGDPSGVSLHFYNPRLSWDFLAAWDFDDYFFLNVHGLFHRPLVHRPLGNRSDLQLFYGPGGFIGFRDRPNRDDDDVTLGISGTVGIAFFIEQFEIYGRVTPMLSVVPDTDGEVGGGIGVRYYF